MKIGEILLLKEHITPDELAFALWQQKACGGKIGRILVSSGFVTENDLVQCLGYQLGIASVSLKGIRIPTLLTEKYSVNMCLNYRVVPFSIDPDSGALEVATSEFNDESVLRAMKDIFPSGTRVSVAGTNDLLFCIWENWVQNDKECISKINDLKNSIKNLTVELNTGEHLEIIEEIDFEPEITENLLNTFTSNDPVIDSGVEIIEENSIEDMEELEILEEDSLVVTDVGTMDAELEIKIIEEEQLSKKVEEIDTMDLLDDPEDLMERVSFKPRPPKLKK
ncbi:MAG: hypothetical protein JXR95_12170 [Deltaproteobacteria bacterium]|nr:hypothetical protein [Deltaproteobacteria bacterium]